MVFQVYIRHENKKIAFCKLCDAEEKHHNVEVQLGSGLPANLVRHTDTAYPGHLEALKPLTESKSRGSAAEAAVTSGRSAQTKMTARGHPGTTLWFASWSRRTRLLP